MYSFIGPFRTSTGTLTVEWTIDTNEEGSLGGRATSSGDDSDLAT